MKKLNFKKPNFSKENVKDSFKNKHFKRGSYSAGMIIVILAIVIVINLVMNQLPTSVTQIDISDEHYFSLGTQTENILKNLDQDVNIYQVVTEGDEDTITTKLLQKYEEESDYIHVSTIDPELNPAFLEKYDASDLESNSLIVESDMRYKVINASDIYEYTYDSTYYTTGTPSSSNYDGEGEITSALDYVVTQDIPIVYTLNGDGEQELSTAVTESIKKENFEINELSLIETENIPEDCDVLAVIAPAYDLSAEVAEKIIAYLEAGGRAVIVSNYTGTDMPNFDSVLEAYGLQLADGFISEGDSNYYYSNQCYLLPQLESHDITDPISKEKLYVMVPFSQPILQMDSVRSTLTFNDLLTTSSDSYTLPDYAKSGNYDKTDTSVSGPFSIAKAVTEEVENGTTKLVLLSSYYTLTDDVTQNLTPANITFFVNCINWMCEHESTINIDSKSLDVEYNTISTAGINTWTAIFVVIIPLVIIIGGLMVWIRRRKA